MGREPGLTSRDKAVLSMGALLGEGVLSTTERERFRTLKAGAEAGPVKSTRDLKNEYVDAFSRMTPRQRKAAQEALYDVDARRELGDNIADAAEYGEDIDDYEDDD